MGIMGSDVAKDAADMILLDDNFSAIISGIEEGRKVFDNLKKTMAYMCVSNISELAPFIFMLYSGVPLPICTILTLLIDIGTDIFPAIGIGYESPELDIMTKPPRRPD